MRARRPLRGPVAGLLGAAVAFAAGGCASSAGGEEASALGPSGAPAIAFQEVTAHGAGLERQVMAIAAATGEGDAIAPPDEDASPFGNFEAARGVEGGVEVTGWAIDPDATAPVYVWATLDGEGRHLLADQVRPDVGDAYPDAGPDHGFVGTLTAAPGQRRVCVTAANVGPGAHESLGCRTVTVPQAPSRPVREAQQLLQGLGVPTGPVDGVWGPRTAQGLCTFRQMAGMTVSREGVSTDDLDRLRAYDAAYSSLGQIPAPDRGGRATYFLATRTCQTMLYVQDGHYSRIFAISTGKADYETPAGSFVLGATWPGWSCSTLFPEECHDRPYGMNALYEEEGVRSSRLGNMYNKRAFLGSYLLHGSGFVPTYPASHGCVRVTIADSDWLYQNITNRGGVVPFDVVGAY